MNRRHALRLLAALPFAALFKREAVAAPIPSRTAEPDDFRIGKDLRKLIRDLERQGAHFPVIGRDVRVVFRNGYHGLEDIPKAAHTWGRGKWGRGKRGLYQ